jgi:hypothetical protein
MLLFRRWINSKLGYSIVGTVVLLLLLSIVSPFISMVLADTVGQDIERRVAKLEGQMESALEYNKEIKSANLRVRLAQQELYMEEIKLLLHWLIGLVGGLIVTGAVGAFFNTKSMAQMRHSQRVAVRYLNGVAGYCEACPVKAAKTSVSESDLEGL